MPTMESVEEPLAVSFWNTNALVADGANNFSVTAPDFKLHRPPRIRVLHRIREQIRKNVPQQALIRLNLAGYSGDCQFDRTSLAGSRKDLVNELSHE